MNQSSQYISEKVRRISGSCSTFLQDSNSNFSCRGAMTFVGSESEEDSDNKYDSISFNVGDSITGRISLIYKDVSPLPYDYILYTTLNNTYLLYIISCNQDDKTSWNATTEILDQWSENSDGINNANDINVSIGCITRVLNRRFLTEEITTNPIIDRSALTVKGYVDISKNSNIDYGLRFNVTSKNSNTLGNFRIQLEFNTDLASPAMDTIIAQRFVAPDSEIPEKMTFRGYMGKYSCLEEVGTYNFDNEKLDNFTVIIKDYNDGLDSKNFSKDICIPRGVLEEARDKGFPYTCKIYGYVNLHDDTYTKVYIGDMSDEIYSTIDEMST